MAKKRINGDGTVWHVKNENRWRAQFPDSTGKRRTLSGKSRKEVETKLREALTQRDNQTLGSKPSEAGTVAQILNSWIERSEPDWEFKTTERVRLDVDRYLKPKIGHIRLNLLTAEMIEDAYIAIKREFELSANSMVHVHSTLRAALQMALRLKTIMVNPIESVKAPKQQRNSITPFTETEWKMLLKNAEAQGTKWSLMWRLTLLLGLRQGEILGLTWENVNLDESTIFICQQLQRQSGRGLILKNLKADAQSRHLVVDPETTRLLRSWKRKQNQEKLAQEKWGEVNLVFTNTIGKPIEPRRAAKKWANLVASSGLPHHKLHDARHTIASLMLEKNVGLKVVSHYLGHADGRTTQNIYQHVNRASQDNVASMIGEMAM